jgi:hypothetical protein
MWKVGLLDLLDVPGIGNTRAERLLEALDDGNE